MSDGGDSVEVVRAVTARLPSGMTSAWLRYFELADALDPVGEISVLVVPRPGKAKPPKTAVGLKPGFAVESGKLTALWVLRRARHGGDLRPCDRGQRQPDCPVGTRRR